MRYAVNQDKQILVSTFIISSYSCFLQLYALNQRTFFGLPIVGGRIGGFERNSKRGFGSSKDKNKKQKFKVSVQHELVSKKATGL